MTLARAHGYRSAGADHSARNAVLADEIFMTGTAAEDHAGAFGRSACTVGAGKRGPITEALQTAFFGLFTGKTPDKWGWLDARVRTRRVAAAGDRGTSMRSLSIDHPRERAPDRHAWR